jgi:membrane-associated phospholipid phosphatase
MPAEELTIDDLNAPFSSNRQPSIVNRQSSIEFPGSKREMRILPAGSLQSTDVLFIAFWGLLSLICLALHGRIPLWWVIITANAAACTLLMILACVSRRTGSRVLRAIHDWSAFALVLFTYKQLYFIIGPIHRNKDYDQLLISLDRLIFRTNPTQWIARFSNPLATELLQIAYSSFYVLFIAVGLELYRRRDKSQFSQFRFTVVYGFFVSYLAYFAFPAAGPRFTLHDFSRIDSELPGLLFAEPLRWFVNYFEAIRPGMPNALAFAYAQRDVFPSGHTMLTLMTIVLAYEYRLRIRNYVLGVGILLIIATVYMRYHYAVDLAAGALLAVPCLLTSDKLHRIAAGKGAPTLPMPPRRPERNPP